MSNALYLILLFGLLICGNIRYGISSIDVAVQEQIDSSLRGNSIAAKKQPTETQELTDNENSHQPSEIQKAVCTVTAGEVRASAEAVTTKTLKGVCGSAAMQAAFADLEMKLYGELTEVKSLLKQLLAQQGLSTEVPPPLTFHPITTAMPRMAPSQNTISTSMRPPLKLQPIVVTTTPVKIHKPSPNAAKLKSLPSTATKTTGDSRDHEVSRFNNTLLSDSELKIFTYYWKLNNFTHYIKGGQSSTIESPTFAIRGKTLQIKAHFQHLHRDFLYLQLEHATKPNNIGGTSRNSISMDMPAIVAGTGNLFRAIIGEQLKFKHKITILDQTAAEDSNGKDLSSPELISLASGFLIPNSALFPSPYIKENALLVQIILYL